MNKAGAIFLFLWTVLQAASAQLPSGTTAPDFYEQDINGQVHHLYDLLDADKIVILEISATWCPPCWAYHQSHSLQNFYNEHGPSGDNKAEVFWVEGDPGTNLACIYDQAACNGFSEGNFADNTPYPILDKASIANAYQITYFPTLFIICPNRRAYEVDALSAPDLWEKAQVCPVAFGQNNAGIFAHDPGYDLPEICDAVNLNPSFMLTNLGSEPLTSASIFLKWNGNNIQTIEWQGNLPTYGEAPIQFDNLSIDEAGTLNTVIASINNNAGDDDFTNNYRNNSYSESQHFEKTQVVLKIRTDDYAKETYWELRDENGQVLEHGGNQLVGPNGGGGFPLGVDIGPGAYSNNSLIRDTLDLPASGCYSIHFVDAYGDGMCCNYGNGYYKLYNINSPTMPIISSGQFEAYDRHAFSAGSPVSAAFEPQESFDISLFPNPASDLLNVEIESAEYERFRILVMNTFGQVVSERGETQAASGTGIQISTAGLPQGLYYLSVSAEPGNAPPVLRKFVVRR